MKWFSRFWTRTLDLMPGKSTPPGTLAALARLNPERFDLENVRSVLGVSIATARTICDTAVRQGVFRHQVQALTPEGRGVATAPTEAELPSTVSEWKDVDGHPEEFAYDTATLRKVDIYSLDTQAASRLYSHSA
jgi:hypothetical protein